MPIRWGDMDAMGHVNNTIYFRYLEQARIAWFDAVIGPVRPDACGPILAHVACDFIKPLVYPGDIWIRQDITRVGRSSVEMDLAIWRNDAPGDLYARGHSVVVWMDYQAKRSVPWPDELRARMLPPAQGNA